MNREKKFLIHYNNLNTNKISSIRKLLGDKKSLEINFDLLNENNFNELESILSIFKFNLKDLIETLFEFNKVLKLINEINNDYLSPNKLLLDSLNNKSNINIIFEINMKNSYPTLNINVKYKNYEFYFKNFLPKNDYSIFSFFSMCSVDSDKLKFSIRELILKDYILNNFCNISYDDIQDKDDYYIKKIFELEEILNY